MMRRKYARPGRTTCAAQFSRPASDCSSCKVDLARTSQLMRAAGSMEVTFHRAVDMTPSIHRAVSELLSIGVKRVLTSGGEADSIKGASVIKVSGAHRWMDARASGGSIDAEVECASQHSMRAFIANIDVMASHLHAS
jgi:copper homeostasis protein CutC